MSKDFLLNKLLPVILVVSMIMLLSIGFFIVLFDYIETKQIRLLEKQGDVVVQPIPLDSDMVDNSTEKKLYVFPPEVLERLQIDPNVEPYVFSPEVLERLQIDPNVEPYVFSPEVLAKLQSGF